MIDSVLQALLYLYRLLLVIIFLKTVLLFIATEVHDDGLDFGVATTTISTE